jgi:2-oxoisovalerate dehydrogenase E1 component beta subunit
MVVVVLTSGGFGAEVVAAITNRCFLHLAAPPVRVCGQDTPFPLVFEPLYLPSVQVSVQCMMQLLLE